MKENNEALINRFYQAFANGNPADMIACYHPNIVFTDPAFGTLEGVKACNMWRMLVVPNKVALVFKNVQANEITGSAQWQATYLFGPQNRKVINIISAEFVFKDGLVIKHTDTFDLWKWARQAMGWKGWLLGNTAYFQKKLHKTTAARLKAFEARR